RPRRHTATGPGQPSPPSGSRAQSPARRGRYVRPAPPGASTRGRSMAVETITTNLVFTGPLTWADEAACRGESRLFFAPAGERPEARATREVQARAVCR